LIRVDSDRKQICLLLSSIKKVCSAGYKFYCVTPKSIGIIAIQTQSTNMKLYFSETRNDEGRIISYRDVKAYYSDKNELVIYCCDINNTAKEMWGDSGVEFYLIISEENKYKLANKLGLNEPPDEKLLEKIYAKFGEEDACFENIMRYFKSNNIEFNYQRW
jgi:hypothetical protein